MYYCYKNYATSDGRNMVGTFFQDSCLVSSNNTVPLQPENFFIKVPDVLLHDLMFIDTEENLNFSLFVGWSDNGFSVYNPLGIQSLTFDSNSFASISGISVVASSDSSGYESNTGVNSQDINFIGFNMSTYESIGSVGSLLEVEGESL